MIAFPEFPGVESTPFGHKMKEINLEKITDFLDPLFEERDGYRIYNNLHSNFIFVYRNKKD